MTTDKAAWDVSSTSIFIELCIVQIYKKERLGSAFTRDRWKSILSGFNEKTEKSYTKKQLKNRLDSLKREWSAWDKLFSKETGIAIDYSRNMVNADDEWWERKIKENKAYGKYRHNGMKFARELQIIFNDVLATGETMFSPLSTQRMSLGDDDNDVYRPRLDLEEGSGDSEEELQGDNTSGSVQVPTDLLDGINLTSNIQPSAPSGSESIGKRKRDGGAYASKKKKMSSYKQLADSVSVITNASKDRADVFKKIADNDDRTSDIVAEILTIPELAGDMDFRRRCCNMMMHRTPSNMYNGLKGDKSTLIEWLREHAYNSPHYLKHKSHQEKSSRKKSIRKSPSETKVTSTTALPNGR